MSLEAVADWATIGALVSAVLASIGGGIWWWLSRRSLHRSSSVFVNALRKDYNKLRDLHKEIINSPNGDDRILQELMLISYRLSSIQFALILQLSLTSMIKGQIPKWLRDLEFQSPIVSRGQSQGKEE